MPRHGRDPTDEGSGAATSTSRPPSVSSNLPVRRSSGAGAASWAETELRLAPQLSPLLGVGDHRRREGDHVSLNPDTNEKQKATGSEGARFADGYLTYVTE